MFPKNLFNGNTKGLAKSHWLEFKKYLDYQQQQGFIDPMDQNAFAEIKQMFRMTLNDNALGWYDADHTNWTNIEQMQQAFLKRFNIWGDTRCQQQDSWNKLRFNMAKDDVDVFVTDMKTLASILSHNDDVLAEKFKDVFPDKNIEAALIAMDNLEDMQAKAKQLVHIYKPQQESDSSLGACLMHQHQPAAKEKNPKKTKQKESNQHQLAPIQGKQGPNGNPNNSQGQRQRQFDDQSRQQGGRQNDNNDGYFRKNNFRGGRGRGRGHGHGHGRGQWNDQNSDRSQSKEFHNNRGRGQQGPQGRGQGFSNPGPQGYVPQYQNPAVPQNYNYMQPPPTPPAFLLPTPPPYDPNWQLRQTQFYSLPAATGQYQPQVPAGSAQKQRQTDQANHICELCGNRGHYDYQCQFAGDFMNRTRKAFQRSHYMHEYNDQEWSQEDDQGENAEQPFQ